MLGAAALLGAAIAKFANSRISHCKFSEPVITAYLHQLARKKAREEVVTRKQNMVIAAQGVVGGKSNGMQRKYYKAIYDLRVSKIAKLLDAAN